MPLRRRNVFARLNSTDDSTKEQENEELKDFESLSTLRGRKLDLPPSPNSTDISTKEQGNADLGTYENLTALLGSNLLSPRNDVSERIPGVNLKHDDHRILGRRRKEVGEVVTLDVGVLGGLGEVLVLPYNIKSPRKYPDDAESIDSTESPTVDELADDVEEARRASSVNELIESMRSPYQQGNQLDPTAWENLWSKVSASFTNAQLSDYISQHGRTVIEGNTAPWIRGKSEFLRSESVSKGLHGLSGKQMYVERVLRDCWQLEILNEVGQIDLTLPRAWLFLLMHSKNFYLQELASVHEATVDVSFDLELLRITGTRHSCESVRDVVQDVCTRMRSEDIALLPSAKATSKKEQKLRRNIPLEFQDQVSETYGVALERKGRSGPPEKVHYLAEDQKRADDSRRTFSLAASEALKPRASFFTYTSEAGNIWPVDPGDNVTWPQRREQWHRWAVPPAKHPFHQEHTINHSYELLSMLEFWKWQKKASRSIGPGVYQKLTATVGRSLFSGSNLSHDTSIHAFGLDRLAQWQTFNTDIPRLTNFLRFMDPFPQDSYEPSYLIQLTPSPFYSEVLPRLEFEVSAGPSQDGDLNFSIARAIIGEQKVDYLLPECGLDLRFSRAMYRDLLPSSSSSPGFEGLFGESIYNCITRLLSDTGSSQPAFWSIPVPKSLQLRESSEDVVMGEYIIPPFEDILDSCVDHYDFHGKRLSYRGYCAGPFFPRHTTDLFLSMTVPTPVPKDERETFDKEFHAFCNTACRLAYDVDTAK